MNIAMTTWCGGQSGIGLAGHERSRPGEDHQDAGDPKQQVTSGRQQRSRLTRSGSRTEQTADPASLEAEESDGRSPLGDDGGPS